MVIGHTESPFTNYIYLFHMAVFFMASGYFWNEKHIVTFKSLVKYVIAKIKALYFPYLICNIILLIIEKIFLYGDERMSPILFAKEVIVSFVKTSLFVGSVELGGPTWFFGCLLLVTVGYAMLFFVVNKITILHKNKMIVHIAFWVACILISWGIDSGVVDFGIEFLNRLFPAYCVYELGMFIRKIEEEKIYSNLLNIELSNKTYNIVYFISSATGLLILNCLGSISIATCKIVNPIFFALTSCLGWIMLSSLSASLPQILKELMIYLGKNTKVIVCWHLLSFKIVTYIYILCNNSSIERMREFPTLKEPSGLWPVYSFVGITFPLVMHSILKKVIKKETYKKI